MLGVCSNLFHYTFWSLEHDFFLFLFFPHGYVLKIHAHAMSLGQKWWPRGSVLFSPWGMGEDCWYFVVPNVCHMVLTNFTMHFTYDVLKRVSQVVFTSTTLYPIFFAQNFGPISYLCKGGQCKSLCKSTKCDCSY
jgi:hypothetical protein